MFLSNILSDIRRKPFDNSLKSSLSDNNGRIMSDHDLFIDRLAEEGIN